VTAVARLGTAFGDRLVSLDVNPIIVGPRGAGAVAVDLLIELGPDNEKPHGSELAYTIGREAAGSRLIVQSPTPPRQGRSR
jgi:hypothetical protein